MRRYHVGIPAGLLGLAWVTQALAGGGGENMLLVVNPSDENSLRVANVYAQARGIPSSNIIFSQPPNIGGTNGYNHYLTSTDFTNTLLNPIRNRLAALGPAAGQINYIATLGEPESVLSGGNWLSTGHVLNRLDQYAANVDNTGQLSQTGLYELAGKFSPLYALYSDGTLNPPWTPYTRGSNAAIRHSTTYTETTVNNFSRAGGTMTYYPFTVAGGNMYMGGTAAYTGFGGNSADQAIANLQRTVNGDGAKPTGTVYFEQNSDIRTTIRSNEWPEAQAGLTARGIPYVQEMNTPGATPQNRTDVRGAVIGAWTATTPNGSTYLPGSWVDNLTSYGAAYDLPLQTKLTSFIAAGAGASSGTVEEPYALFTRFPDAMIHNFIADGSTLGEAFYKSVADPQLQMFTGDMLSQAYADVPHVAITAGPTQGQTVKGQISVSAAATAPTSSTTTGVAKLQLYVDGKLNQTIAAAGGAFNLDTSTLTDGQHELRVVAINDSQAASEGYTARNIVVNNHGQSVSIAGGNQTLSASQVAPIAVSAMPNGASISRIELRCLGRTLGTLSGAASGNISLNAAQLAYGDNTVVPVAVLSDGSEVAGSPITVQRTPQYLAGQTPTPAAQRVAGVKAEYFYGKGAATIAGSNFSGTPDLTTTQSMIKLYDGTTTTLNLNHGTPNAEKMAATTTSDKLAVRLTGNFNVTAAQAGEFTFFFNRSNDAAQLTVDGQFVTGFDNAQWNENPEGGGSVFLDAGQHTLQVLASNVIYSNTDTFDLSVWYRGPDGVTNLADGTFLYQPVPEPTSAVLLVGLSGLLLIGLQPLGRLR